MMAPRTLAVLIDDAKRIHGEGAKVARSEILCVGVMVDLDPLQRHPQKEQTMICRIWRGWTTRQNANAYQAVVHRQVIPDIEARTIPGFRQIDLIRRDTANEVEFSTIMWFDGIDSVREFMGEDYTASHVPPAAQAVLSRFDSHAVH